PANGTPNSVSMRPGGMTVFYPRSHFAPADSALTPPAWSVFYDYGYSPPGAYAHASAAPPSLGRLRLARRRPAPRRDAARSARIPHRPHRQDHDAHRPQPRRTATRLPRRPRRLR